MTIGESETERWLRAITCEGCRKNLPFEYHGQIYDEAEYHRDGTTIDPCTYNPKLLPLFQQGVAGAYAAAAKAVHTVIAEAASQDEAERQWELKARIATDILALTPADARQASQQHEALIKQLAFDECNHQHALSHDAIEADFARDQTAAIASAEARARLEEAEHIARDFNRLVDSVFAIRLGKRLAKLRDIVGKLAAAHTPKEQL